MNQMQSPYLEPMPPDLQDQIDLLVERELLSGQRQALIERLDRQPELWRRCAIVFMERDALRGSLFQIARQQEMASPPRPEILLTESKGFERTSRKTTNPIAKAAAWISASILCVALGFGLGLQQRNDSRSTVAQATPSNQPVNKALSVELAQNDPAVWLQVSNAVNRLSVNDGRVVALVHVARANGPTEILPIIQSHQLAEQVIASPRPRLSRDLIDQVERAGWELNTTRQFLSLHLPDGENRVLPVDTLNYRYVGNEIF